MLMSRKTQPSTHLRRNANYTQEHGNIQIEKQLQKIFPNRRKNVYISYY